MTLLDIDVVGTPKGQPRPRAFARHGKARMYDPGTAEHWKSQIAAYVPGNLTPHLGPVRVSLTFRLARPQAHYLRGTVRASAPYYVATKPDVDNLAKAVLDALTQLGVWRDDAQVVALDVLKRYVRGAERPGCVVIVEALSA